MNRNATPSPNVYVAVDRQRFFEIDLTQDRVVEICVPHVCEYRYWGDGAAIRYMAQANRGSTLREFRAARMRVANTHRMLIEARKDHHRRQEQLVLTDPQAA